MLDGFVSGRTSEDGVLGAAYVDGSDRVRSGYHTPRTRAAPVKVATALMDSLTLPLPGQAWLDLSFCLCLLSGTPSPSLSATLAPSEESGPSPTTGIFRTD